MKYLKNAFIVLIIIFILNFLFGILGMYLDGELGKSQEKSLESEKNKIVADGRVELEKLGLSEEEIEQALEYVNTQAEETKINMQNDLERLENLEN